VKKRKSGARILYAFSGPLQEDLERYQLLAEFLRERGWELLGLSEGWELQLRRLLEAGAVDAVVAEPMSSLWLESLPHVPPWVGTREAEGGRFWVDVDWADLGRRAARHLREQGYQRLALWEPQRMPRLAEAFGGMRIRNRAGLQLLLEEDDSPLGICCVSDFQARQLLRLAKELALVVPEQLGLVGVGNQEWQSLLAGRSLSSFPVPARDWARSVAQLLEEALDGAPARGLLVQVQSLRLRESSRRKQEGLLPQFLGWLEEDVADPPAMEELARRAGRSRRSFEQQIKTESGLSPYAHLIALRMQQARRLLRESDWPQRRIGEEIGIPDPARFSAFFKKHQGLPPGRWRKQG